MDCDLLLNCLVFVFVTVSGIGSLVQPMVWYYQTTFSLPLGNGALHLSRNQIMSSH